MRDQEETVTVLTDAHQAVIKELERHGVMLMEEVEFPPYRVDIYLSGYHVAIEIDGAQHSAKADEERDAKLNATYYLPVFHIAAEDAVKPAHWLGALSVWLAEASKTGEERWAQCEMKTPWL